MGKRSAAATCIVLQRHQTAKDVDSSTRSCSVQGEIESAAGATTRSYDDFLIRRQPQARTAVSFNSSGEPIHQPLRGFPGVLSNGSRIRWKPCGIPRQGRGRECFDDLKNSLDMKRLRMHTSPTVDEGFRAVHSSDSHQRIRKEMRYRNHREIHGANCCRR